jgi:hypothetical protein
MGITPARMCGTSLVLNHVGVNEDSQSGQRQLAWKTQQTVRTFSYLLQSARAPTFQQRHHVNTCFEI